MIAPARKRHVKQPAFLGIFIHVRRRKYGAQDRIGLSLTRKTEADIARIEDDDSVRLKPL
jgi:hypothetical protein